MIKSILIGFLLASITACASAPKISPEQEMETLKIYPDNRVVFELGGQDRGISHNIYAYHNNADEILAYRFWTGTQYSYFNVIDIAKISTTKISSRERRTSDVTMQNGKVYLTYPESFALYRCTKQKVCSLELGDRTFGSIKITAIYSFDLASKDAKPNIYNGFSISYFMPLQTIEISPQSGDAYLQMTQRLNERIRNAEIAQSEIRQQKAERVRFLEQEAKNMRKSAKIGTITNCGQIFDVRLPMVGIQTVAGMQYLQLDSLYGRSADCRFSNGTYVGITPP